MDYFFYGTLLDPDIRRLVLGLGADRLVVQPARLIGFRRISVTGSAIPALVESAGAAVDGLLARGVDGAMAARLRHYEGPDYRLIQVKVAAGRGCAADAAMFLADVPAGARGPWRIEHWQRRHKRAYQRLAAQWMASYRQA